MLRPVGDIVATSWDLYIRDFAKFAPLIILFLIPTPILTFLGLGGLYLNQVTLIFNAFTNLLILVALPILAIIYIWAYLAATKAAYLTTQNQPYTAKETLKAASKLIWPAIYTFIPAMFLIFFGTLLLILPGMIFFVWYTFITNALVVENKRGFKALSESKRLVVGRWWAVAWRSMGAWFCFAIVGALVQIGLSFIITGFTSSPSLITMINNNISSIVNACTTPLIILAFMVIYEDLKTTPVEESPELK